MKTLIAILFTLLSLNVFSQTEYWIKATTTWKDCDPYYIRYRDSIYIKNEKVYVTQIPICLSRFDYCVIKTKDRKLYLQILSTLNGKTGRDAKNVLPNHGLRGTFLKAQGDSVFYIKGSRHYWNYELITWR